MTEHTDSPRPRQDSEQRVREKRENISKIDISKSSPEQVADILLRLDPATLSKDTLTSLFWYSAFARLRDDWGVRMKHDSHGEDTFEYEDNLARILIEKRTGQKDDPATLLFSTLDALFRPKDVFGEIKDKAIYGKQWLSRKVFRTVDYETVAKRAEFYAKNKGKPYMVGLSEGRYYVISLDNFLRKARNNPVESWNSIEVAHYLDYVANLKTPLETDKNIILTMLSFWKKKGTQTIAQNFLKNNLKSYDRVNEYMHDYLKKLLSPRVNNTQGVVANISTAPLQRDLQNNPDNDYSHTARVIFDEIINRDKTKTEEDRKHFQKELTLFFSSNQEDFGKFISQLCEWGVDLDSQGILQITRAYEKDARNSLAILEQKRSKHTNAWSSDMVHLPQGMSSPLLSQIMTTKSGDALLPRTDLLQSPEYRILKVEQVIAQVRRFQEDQVYRKWLQDLYNASLLEKDGKRFFSAQANQLYRESVERESQEMKRSVALRSEKNLQDLSSRPLDFIASKIRDEARSMSVWVEKSLMIAEDTKLSLRRVDAKTFYVNDELCEGVSEIRNVVRSARYFAKLGLGQLSPVLGRVRAMLSRKYTDSALAFDAKDGMSPKEKELMLREFARILFPDDRLKKQFSDPSVTLDQLEKLMRVYLGQGRHTTFLLEQSGIMKEGEMLYEMLQRKIMS